MHCSDGSKAAGASYGVVGVMAAEAITATISKPMRLSRATHNVCGVPRLLGLPIG
jgi:hypothetical protein